MNLNKSMSKLLSNKMVLNVVSVVSLLTIIGYLTMGQLNEVFLFVLLAVIIINFSKNMIIVLGVPLIVVVSYNLLKMNRGFMEGMEIKRAERKDDKKSEEEKKLAEEDSKKSEPKIPLAVVAGVKGSDDKKKTEESFAVPSKKGGQYNIDYAATVEDAYSELNKILDGEGIKRLTDDTQRLMKQQMMLADSMKNMEPMLQGMAPLLKQAETLLGNMNNGSSSLGGLADLAKNLSANMPGMKQQ